MRSRTGFTLIEILVAMVLLSVGLLAMVGSSTVNTRTMVRARNTDVAAIFAIQRLELLRGTACRSQTAGSDTLFRAGAWAAINSWTFTDGGSSIWRIRLTSQYYAGQASTIRSDVLEAYVSCLK